MPKKPTIPRTILYTLLIILSVILLLTSLITTQTASASTDKTQKTYTAMTGHAIWDSLTIQNNIAYVGTEDGLVYAIDLATGQLYWGPISTGDEFCGAPTIDNGTVYLAGTHGGIYAFNVTPSNPQKIWNITVTNSFGERERFYNSPTASNYLLFIAGMGGGFYVYPEYLIQPDALWSYQTDEGTGGTHLPNTFESPVTVSGGVAYIASLNGWVSAFLANATAQTEPLWHIKLEDSFLDSPIVVNGTGYLSGEGGNVYAFPASINSPENRFIWNRTISSIFYNSPAVDNGIVYLAGGNGILYANLVSSNETLWSYNIGEILYASPTVSNGTIYAASVNGSIYAFQAGSTRPSNPLWSYATGDTCYNSPVIDNNTVYIGGVSGAIHAITDSITITLIETGLMPGTNWNATIDGITKTSTSTSISFSVYPNGIYSYNVALPLHYNNQSLLSGNLNVSGQDVTADVSFIGSVDHMYFSIIAPSITAGNLQSFDVLGHDYFCNDLGPIDATLYLSPSEVGSIDAHVIRGITTGTWLVTASYPGIRDINTTLTVVPGDLDHIAVTSALNTIVAGGQTTFSAEGFDAYNNSLGSQSVTFSIPSEAGGPFSGNSVTATKAGVWNVTASFATYPDVYTILTVEAGPLDHIVLPSLSGNLTAGNWLDLSAEGFDSYNNSIGPVAANLTLPVSAGGSVAGSSISATKVGSWQVTASYPGVNNVTFNLTVNPSTLNHISLVDSSENIVAGGSTSFPVIGYDAYGNTLGTMNATYSLPSNAGGSASGSNVSATKAGQWPITVSYPGVSSVTGTLTVTPGALNHMGLNSSSPSLTAGGKVNVTAIGYDAYGNDLGPLNVTLSIPSGADGSISGGWVSATKAGLWSVTASFPGIGDVALSLSVSPGALSYLLVSSSSSGVVAGGSLSLNVEGFDCYGNSLGNLTALLSVSSGAGGSVNGNSVSATKVGTWTVTISYPGMDDVLSLFTVTAGPLDHIGFTSGSGSITAGGSTTFAVEGFDVYGNTLGPVTATLSFQSGAGGSITGNSVSATKAGSWAVTASYPGVKSATQTLNVSPSSLDHIEISSSDGTIMAGGSQTFSAKGYDAYGNSLGDVNAQYSVSSDAGGFVEGNKVSATKAGSYTVTASSGTAKATAPLKVNPGPATQLAVSSIPSKTKSNAHVVTVTAKDAYGNTASGYNGVVCFSPNGIDLGLPCNATLRDGVGTFEVTSTEEPTIVVVDAENPAINGTQVGSEVVLPAETSTQNPTETPLTAVPYSLNSLGLVSSIAAGVVLGVSLIIMYEKRSGKRSNANLAGVSS